MKTNETASSTMTLETAKAIRAAYEKYDNAFRLAKKAGDHKVASAHKAKRDALRDKIEEAVAVTNAAK